MVLKDLDSPVQAPFPGSLSLILTSIISVLLESSLGLNRALIFHVSLPDVTTAESPQMTPS